MTGGGVGEHGTGTVDVLMYMAVVAASTYLVLALLPLALKPFASFRATVTWTWEPRPWLARLLGRWRRRRP